MNEYQTRFEIDSQLPQETNFSRFRWTQVIWFLIAWLTLFTLGTLLVANPFWLEKSASATPDYYHVMYLHGLLVGLAGVVILIAFEIFRIRSRMLRKFILFASVIATVLVGLGGLFDASQKIRWFWLSLHIIGFFSLDAIFIAFFIGLFQELRAKSSLSRSLPFKLAIISGFSLEIAALIGHASGWILDFGDHPALIGKWAGLAGETVSDLSGNLIASHSHEIVVAMLSLLIAIVSMRFGYQSLRGMLRLIASAGLWLVIAGTVIMTLLYVLGGITSIQPPTLLISGPNGIASDDLVTGIGVMIGGLMTIIALILMRKEVKVIPSRCKTPLYAIAASWLLLVLTVVGAGYYIELNEEIYGAGNPQAPAELSDAVYTFAHQDFSFFLIPVCIALIIITNIALQDYEKTISRNILMGMLIAFIGIITYIFIDPESVHGISYFITSAGLLIIIAKVIFFLRSLWNIAFGK